MGEGEPILSETGVPHVVVVSSSLSAASRSRVGAAHAARMLEGWGLRVSFLDLATVPLSPYPTAEADPDVQAACALFNGADAWFLATPVYNFSISGTLLTFLHYALAGDQGTRWRPFVLLASLDGLRAGLALDHLFRTLQHERSSVAVGPPLLGVANQLDPVTGSVSYDMNQRMELSLRALVHFARARMTLQEFEDPQLISQEER